MRSVSLIVALAFAGCLAQDEPRPEDPTDPAAPVADRPDLFHVVISGPTPFDEDCTPSAHGTGRPDVVVEPHIAVDPHDPDHLVATWQQDRYTFVGGSRSDLTAASFDGGMNWTSPALVPGLSACTGGDRDRASDPHVSIGAGGAAWFTGMAVTEDPERGDFDGDVLAAVSDDQGVSWRQASLLAGDDGVMWHEWPVITADPDVPGTAWAAWAAHTAPDPGFPLASADVAGWFATTTDGGRTWSEPAGLPGNTPGMVEWPLGLVALGTADERVLVLVDKQYEARADGSGQGTLRAIRSSDGGATWEQPVAIAAYGTGPVEPQTTLAPVQAGQDAAMTAWIESTAGQEVVHVATSRDGIAWQVETVADLSEPDAVLIGVAQAADGTRGVSWYLPSGALFLATDGDAWSTQRLQSPGQRPSTIGDYQSMVATTGGFGLVYTVGPLEDGHGDTNIVFTRVALER